MKKITNILAFALTIAITLSGCSTTKTTNTAVSQTPAADTETTPDATSSATIALPSNVKFDENGIATVTHKYGVTVVPENPQRILSIKVEDLLLALDVDMVAGSNFDGFYLQDMMNERGIPSISVNEETNAVNYEEILSYQPDLIIMRDSFDQTTYDELSKIAPTIAFNLQDKVNSTLAIGAVLGIEDKAKARIEAYNNFLAEAREKLQKKIGDESVAMVRILKKEIRVYPYSTNEMSDFLYSETGLSLTPDPIAVENDTADNLAISMEKLPELSAKHIILIAGYGSNTQENVEAAKARYDEIKSDPLWEKVPAVQDGNIFEVDSRIWLTHGLICTEMKVQGLLDLLDAN